MRLLLLLLVCVLLLLRLQRCRLPVAATVLAPAHPPSHAALWLCVWCRGKVWQHWGIGRYPPF